MPQQFDPSKPFEAAPPFDPSKPFTAAETVTGAHPEAKMSAAAPGMALPAGDDQSVTLGDLLHDPVDAMSRIGAAVKRDVSDPKLWASIALGYFGPKAADVVVPAVANAARATMRGAVAAAPDAVGVISPRAGNVIRMAQKFGQAMQQTPAEAPVEAAPVAQSAPPQPQPSPLEVTRAARDAYRAANGGAVQLASPAPTAPAVAAPPATAPAAPPAAAVPEPAPVPRGTPEPAPAPQTAPAPAQAAPQARNPATALKQAKDTFSAASEVPRPGELNRAMNFIMWGKSPDEALAAVLAQRAGGAATAVDPAAELLKRGVGVSDADAAAAILKRGYKR